MAYNHGREERKWRIWKEAEEKVLRECGVDEAVIEQIRIDDRADFNSNRRFYRWTNDIAQYFDEMAGKQIITAFSVLGSDVNLTSFYIRSPRLRDEFKKIILEAFSEEDDLLNADLICALFVTEELEYIFPRTEIWDIVNNLDNYSILALLEKVAFDYNVANVFNSVDDVTGFAKMLDRRDVRIDELVFEILSDIPLKSAIDVLAKHQYEPRTYDVDNILITLLKETNLKQYEEFYLICRKVKLDNCDEIEKILIFLCDYFLDDSKIVELIPVIQLDFGKVDMERRDRKKILRFVCDILNKQIDLFDEKNIKIIKQFTKKAKQYYTK